MSDHTPSGSEHQCPEPDCYIEMGRTELRAHLEWDHNRSELESYRMLERSFDTGSDRTHIIECPVCGFGVRVEKGREAERREYLQEKCSLGNGLSDTGRDRDA